MKVLSRPLRPARAASLLATVLLMCVFLCGSVAVHAGSDDLPTPEWSFSCKSPFQVCSTVETYRYWNENPKERLHFAVNGLVKDVNNKKYVTVWLLMDEPNVEFAKELARADFYVMMVYPRGTQLSTTHYTCTEAKPAYTDQCWLTEKCAAELAARSAKKDDLFNASHFTADQVAHDVEWLMRTLGDGRPNVLVTQGLSSVFAMRMLQLHPQVPVGVIMMDQVNPVYFDTYGYLGGAGFDVALQHLLAQCDDDALCVGRLGAMEGTWARLQTLVSLAKGNKLTCAKKLSWGGSKQLGSSFADQLRSVLALMMRFPAYPFVASKVDLMSLIPSMLYRLQRCAEKDINPLNTLYSYVTSAKSFTCPVDVPVQTNWLVNDFLQSSPPKSVDKYWAGEANRRTVQPALMSSKEFNTVVSKMPSVARTNLSRLLPVNATQKILFLSADLDPMAPRGTASVAAVAFRSFSSSVRAVQLRGITNAPAEALTPCLLNNLRFYKEHREWADADTCTMDSAKQLDFLNGPTKDYYGVGDGWDFDLPNNDDGSSRSSDNGGGGGGGSVLKKIFRVLLILIVIAAVGAGGYYGYFYFKARGFRYNRVSDNFYDNLQT